MSAQGTQVNEGREPDLLDTAQAGPATDGVVFPEIDAKNLPAVQAEQHQVAVAPVQGPMAGAIQFLNAGGNVAQLREMMALQREWEAVEAKKAFFDAMARFKANPPEILKDKRVYFESRDGKGATDYWHATLGNVCEAITEGLAEQGITHRWQSRREGDRIFVRCILRHVAGHEEWDEIDGPVDDSGKMNNLQRGQSTRSYLQRYSLLMVSGMAVKDEIMPDDDGRSGGGEPGGPPDAEKSPYNRARDTIADKELVQQAEDASLEGWDKFKLFTSKLTPTQRTALEPISAWLKDAAKDATNSANSAQLGSTKA